MVEHNHGNLCDVTDRNILSKRLRSENTDNANFACGYNTKCVSTRRDYNNEQYDSAFLAFTDEPKTFSEAINSEYSKEWIEAMDSEYESLMKNNTWLLVEPPDQQCIIDNKWVFRVKEKSNGEFDRFKARLVAHQTFSPVAKFTSIRSMLVLKTAFLNGSIHVNKRHMQKRSFEDLD